MKKLVIILLSIAITLTIGLRATGVLLENKYREVFSKANKDKFFVANTARAQDIVNSLFGGSNHVTTIDIDFQSGIFGSIANIKFEDSRGDNKVTILVQSKINHGLFWYNLLVQDSSAAINSRVECTNNDKLLFKDVLVKSNFIGFSKLRHKVLFTAFGLGSKHDNNDNPDDMSSALTELLLQNDTKFSMLDSDLIIEHSISFDYSKITWQVDNLTIENKDVSHTFNDIELRNNFSHSQDNVTSSTRLLFDDYIGDKKLEPKRKTISTNNEFSISLLESDGKLALSVNMSADSNIISDSTDRITNNLTVTEINDFLFKDGFSFGFKIAEVNGSTANLNALFSSFTNFFNSKIIINLHKNNSSNLLLDMTLTDKMNLSSVADIFKRFVLNIELTEDDLVSLLRKVLARLVILRQTDNAMEYLDKTRAQQPSKLEQNDSAVSPSDAPQTAASVNESKSTSKANKAERISMEESLRKAADASLTKEHIDTVINKLLSQKILLKKDNLYTVNLTLDDNDYQLNGHQFEFRDDEQWYIDNKLIDIDEIIK